jgi:hypothetical protein
VNDETTQVVIVGGGPVGVALAVDLGLRGISCALVERRVEPQRIPKGQNLTQRSVRIYFWGIADELRAARVLPPDPMSGIVAYGSLTGEYWYAPRSCEIVNLTTSRKRAAAPVPDRTCAGGEVAELANVDTRLAGLAQTVEQDAGMRVAIVMRTAMAERSWRLTLCGGLRRQLLHCPLAARHRARRRGFQPAHGVGRGFQARARAP